MRVCPAESSFAKAHTGDAASRLKGDVDQEGELASALHPDGPLATEPRHELRELNGRLAKVGDKEAHKWVRKWLPSKLAQHEAARDDGARHAAEEGPPPHRAACVRRARRSSVCPQT